MRASLTPKPVFSPLLTITLVTTVVQKSKSRCVGEQQPPGTQIVCLAQHPAAPTQPKTLLSSTRRDWP